VAVFAAAGTRLDLPAWMGQQEERVDVPVLLGAAAHAQGRLLGVLVPPAVAAERRRKPRAHTQREGGTPRAARLALADWTLVVTNVLAELLSVPEALLLARARWQIELLIELWKSHGQIEESRSSDPWRIRCERYAKLIAMVIQHWVLLVGCWTVVARSLAEAARTIRREATCLVGAIRSRRDLAAALGAICRCLHVGCRVDRRVTKPGAVQLLQNTSLGGFS
jgi:hypothetical protein